MNNQCEPYSHLIPDYCLGTLEAAVRAEIEALLPECPELADLITAYESLAEPLLYSAPPTTAPAHILDNILQETRPTAYNLRRFNLSVNLWRNLVAAIVIMVLFCGSNIYWYQRAHNLEQEVSQLNGELATIAQVQPTTLVGNQNLGNTVANPYNTQQIPIGISMNNTASANNIGQISNYSPMNTANQLNTQTDQYYASLTWSPGSDTDTWIGVFSAQNFNMNSEDSIYQLWLNRHDETALSAGVFGVNDWGNGVLVFEIEEPIESFDTISVTNEPLTGSFIPTSDPIISANLHNWTNLP